MAAQTACDEVVGAKPQVREITGFGVGGRTVEKAAVSWYNWCKP